VALAGLAEAGCASQPAVALPPRAAGPAASASWPGAARPTIRDQVVAAYTGYWRASGDALDAGRPGRARAILARYVTAGALPALIAALQQDWSRHATADGAPVLHIMSVTVRRSAATVHDCIDLSHAGLRNTVTGRVYPRSFGSPRANYFASLVRRDGRWLVRNIVPVVASCDP
jgi:hypothetical protein